MSRASAGKPAKADGQAGLDVAAPLDPPWPEGVGITAVGARSGAWRVRSCASWSRRGRPSSLASRDVQRRRRLTREVESLVADLLGATLVDAQDELWAAWSALERAGSPGRRANG